MKLAASMVSALAGMWVITLIFGMEPTLWIIISAGIGILLRGLSLLYEIRGMLAETLLGHHISIQKPADMISEEADQR